MKVAKIRAQKREINLWTPFSQVQIKTLIGKKP